MTRTTSSTIVTLLVMTLAGCTSPAQNDSPPEVVMKDNAFAPSSLTASVGDVISFRNDDTVTHVVVFEDKTLNTPAGTTSQRSFDGAGDYAYVCQIHGTAMRGTIHVMA